MLIVYPVLFNLIKKRHLHIWTESIE
jgi:hypothetical protein